MALRPQKGPSGAPSRLEDGAKQVHGGAQEFRSTSRRKFGVQFVTISAQTLAPSVFPRSGAGKMSSQSEGLQLPAV